MNRASLIREFKTQFPRAASLLREARTNVRRIFARDVISANRSIVLENEPWQIDSISIEDGLFRVQGWALPPLNSRPVITLNGLHFESVEHVDRPDVGSHFWQRADANRSGFHLASRIESARPFKREYAQLSYANAPTSLPYGLVRDWYLRDPAREGAVPTPIQRARVVGNTDEFGFHFTGATDFKRLAAAATAVAGRPVREYASVLDWGVGCGRLARHALREIESERFTGCDIDADNVAWCRSNLEGTYHHTNLEPPLPFGSESFDLIYGVSVFTHLKEALQDAWLAELGRVLRPGGVALMTTHGQTALDYIGVEPQEYVALKNVIAREGLLISSQNSDLIGAVERPEEYVNVFHSPDYIRSRWSRWLDVVAIVPGYIYTHDLVVLRRRNR